MLKVCGDCKEGKDTFEYYKDRTKVDGLARRCKSCHGKRNAAYRKKNPQYGKVWREKNKTKKSLDNAKYRSENSLYFLNYHHNYRADKLSLNHGCVTEEGLKRLIEAKNNSCEYCGKPFEHLDHTIPLSKGGLHCLDNLTISCARCNISKGNKMPKDFSLKVC